MDSTKLQRIALSVLVATALWLSVKLVQQYSTTLQQPVRYSNLPIRLELASPLPNTLGVTYEGRGHRLMLKALTIRRDTLTVDIPPEAVRRGYLLTEALRNPLSAEAQLQVRHIGPDTLPLAFENRILKRVPVQSRLELTLAEGYLLTRPPDVQPDSVQLLGTSRQLAEVDRWPTVPQRLTNVRNDVVEVLPIARDPGVIVSPQHVQVRLSVAKYTEDTVQVPVRRLGLRGGQYVRLAQERVVLRYRVPFDQAGTIAAEAFAVGVDVSNLNPAAQVVVPQVLRAPASVRDVRIEPPYLPFVLGTNRSVYGPEAVPQ